MSDPHSQATGITPLTTYLYDELGRVEEIGQRVDGATILTTSYAYDLHDNLITVTDAEGNVTTYTADDFGQTRSVDSPVTGVTTHEYDPAGNRTTTTHASGRNQTWTYDAASRLTSEASTFLGFTETALWLYDDTTSGNLGLGRLTGMVHGGDEGKDAATFYRYERRGLVTEETQLIADTVYQVDHAYDDNANQTGLTLGFLDGLVLTFTHDDTDRPSGVTYTAGFGSGTLAAQVEHEPFGPVRSYYNGGTDLVTRTYDQAYRLTGLQTGEDGGPTVLDRTYQWADGQNLSSWTDGARTLTASYDNLSRLTGYSDTAGDDYGYTLDGIGNRLTETQTGGISEDWTYRYLANGSAGNTSLLLDLADSVSGEYLSAAHDDDGNLTYLGKGDLMLGYSPAQRLAGRVERGVGARYTYDARGYLVRVQSDDATSELSDLRLVYDHGGRLLALMHDASFAGLDRGYVWLEGQPLAELVPDFKTQVWWVVGDHLGLPALQYASATRYARPWYEPYGELIEKVETGGASPPLDLRFPGQLDLTHGGDDWVMHYNMHRWYLAGVGAYSQADPIGLAGGGNLYLYATGKPTRVVDPLGLYGTNDCTYYERRCAESGGAYYCEIAPAWCNRFPKYPDPDPGRDNDFEGWPRCTRKCLQDCDEGAFDERRRCLDPYPHGPHNPDPETDKFTDSGPTSCHAYCYTFCYLQKWGHDPVFGRPVG